MKTILIITLLFLTSNLFAQKTIYTDNSGNGVIEYTLIDKDGEIQEKGFYFNNKRTGTWTRYSSSGKSVKLQNSKMVKDTELGLFMTKQEKKFSKLFIETTKR